MQQALGNAFKHLVACFGSVDQVHRVYDAALHEQMSASRQGSMDEFVSRMVANPYDMAIYAWLQLIVLCSLPLSIVENEVFRLQSKHYKPHEKLTHFSIKFVSRVIFQLVELVELAISKELKSAMCGAIMHDGWSRGGIHYLGLFATYVKEMRFTKKGKATFTREAQSVLLSIAPIAHKSSIEGEDSGDVYAASFNAEAHHFHLPTYSKSITTSTSKPGAKRRLPTTRQPTRSWPPTWEFHTQAA